MRDECREQFAENPSWESPPFIANFFVGVSRVSSVGWADPRILIKGIKFLFIEKN